MNTKAELKPPSLLSFANQLHDHERSSHIPFIVTPLFIIGRMCISGNVVDACNYIWTSNEYPSNLYTIEAAVKVILTTFRENKIPFPYDELIECKDRRWGWSNWKKLSLSVIKSIDR